MKNNERRINTMTRKQIDTAREARLWVGQIIVPTATVVVTALTIPEVRQCVVTKFRSTKEFIAKKFKKERA